MVLFDFKKENEQIIIYILGVLSAIDTQIFSFYFGSSHGSQQKDSRRRKADSMPSK